MTERDFLWFYMNELLLSCIFTLTATEWDFVIHTWMNWYWGIFTLTEWDFCDFTWMNCYWSHLTLTEWEWFYMNEKRLVHLYTNWVGMILHDMNCYWGIFTLTEWDFVILHEWTDYWGNLYTNCNWMGFSCDFTWMNSYWKASLH